MTSNWRDEALCREVDSEVFFIRQSESAKPAKRICAQCPARAACLAEALALPQYQDRHGVFGGATPRERAQLRRKAAKPLAPVIPLAAPAATAQPRRAA